MDLVNLMYRYINKFINSDELIKGLKNIELSKFSEAERKKINKLISSVEKIITTIPNELDEVEKKRLTTIDHMLEILGNTKELNNSDKEANEFLNKQYDKLLKDKSTIRDGGNLYVELFQLMTNNPLVVKYAKKMNDKELLEFITKYISAPLPPVINQEGFNDLVKVGIKDDKREALWRLAFNYEHKNINFSLIEDYFIEKRDAYYLIELISAVQEDLDVDKIIQKVISTKEKDFMKDCAERAKHLGLITDEEIKKLKEHHLKI